MNNSFEKIPTHIFENQTDASKIIAQKIAEEIRAKQAEGKDCVLGLATGSSPKNVYKELVRMHREEGLSFANVVSFNLDEYYPISKTAPQSYDNFMKENLFNHVDIKPENINIPNGEIPKDEVKEHCREYEEKSIPTAASISRFWGLVTTATSVSTSRALPCSPKRV